MLEAVENYNLQQINQPRRLINSCLCHNLSDSPNKNQRPNPRTNQSQSESYRPKNIQLLQGGQKQPLKPKDQIEAQLINQRQ